MRSADSGKINGSFLKTISDFRMVLIFAGMVILFSILSPYFLKLQNLYAIGLTISVIGIICIGQSLVLLTGLFDLSVGAVAGFAGMMVAILTKQYGHYTLMVFLGIAVGTLIGLINGLLVTKAHVNALITTLAMMSIFNGATFLISKGYAVGLNDETFRFLGTTHIFGLPLPILILVFLYAVFAVMLKWTVFGRYIYSIGGNKITARLSGINIDFIQTSVFALSGALSAFGGILLASRLGSAQVSAGAQYPLNSIAASVLGGISLAGGKGNILGALVGVAIIGVLQSGLIMIDMPSYYQWMATGIVLIAAVYFDERLNRKA